MSLPKYGGFQIEDFVPNDLVVDLAPESLISGGDSAVPALMVGFHKQLDQQAGYDISDVQLRKGMLVEIPRSLRNKTQVTIATGCSDLLEVVSFNGLNSRQNLILQIKRPEVALRVLFVNKNHQMCAHYYTF
jgi:hypothetical protein